MLIKEEVYQFFASRFTAQSKYGANLDGVQFGCISEANNEMLYNMFSGDEILGPVRECGGSKSLGSDGFNFNFI